MANFEDLVIRDTRANQPAFGIPGRLYYVTDEGVMERDNGAAWQSVEGAGGAVDFTDLGDVPAAYTGQAGKVVVVNATEDALEFVANPAGDTNTGWVLIASNILAGDGQITFSSIPSTYKELRIVVRARTAASAAADQLKLQVGNSAVDTGNNYAYLIRREGFAAANSTQSATSGIADVIVPGNTATANYYADLEYFINDYAVSTYWRNIRLYGGFADTAASYRINTGIGTWKNTTQAIDTVKLFGVTAADLKAGSAAWLYGMKTS